MGGGKSSSSSSQSTQQIDKRIAASDSATVLQDLSHVNINVTDAGAVAGMKDTANAAINGAGVVAGKVIDLSGATIDDVFEFGKQALNLLATDHTATLDALNKNSSQALTFVDNATKDANARTFDSIAPWLVVGASVIAITYYTRH